MWRHCNLKIQPFSLQQLTRLYYFLNTVNWGDFDQWGDFERFWDDFKHSLVQRICNLTKEIPILQKSTVFGMNRKMFRKK